MIHNNSKINKKNPPILEFDKVGYKYQNFAALSDITFSVHEGEKIVLLGANGSGKSTLLKIIDGLVFADKGTYKAFGEIINQKYFDIEKKSYDFRSKIGFVFQDSDVQLFSSTVFDEVVFAPLHMGFDKNEILQKTKSAMQMMGIEHLSKRAPYRLSGGEKKRVAIASVLSYSPAVWLFDEPTSGLDPRSQSRLIDFIFELNSMNNTVITATHNLSIVQDIADRVIVLSENHKIVADDIPEKILSDSDLLKKYNLIHEHIHRHRGKTHEHIHTHHLIHKH
ncbi:energy-coupling factor ABC transporter ATP-binding protein [Patescibacteria group bacterium]|nr:energy-coupling factor ABC transporter ATP-binding protein [Patescibacteria group bacterium]